MRLTLPLLVLFILSLPVFVPAADAAIYKWVDQDGTVHFTDSPPPTEVEAKVVTPEPNRIDGYGKVPDRPQNRSPLVTERKPVADSDLPIVELFVTSWCGYCKRAEAFFRKRDIPFVKYDIEKDRQAARRKASLTRSRGVPFVLIGEVGIPGYSEAAYEKALRQYQ